MLLLLLSCIFDGREIDLDFFRDTDGLSNDVVEFVWLLEFEVFSKRKLLNVINRLDEDMVEIRFVDLDNNKVEIIDRISKI